MIITVTIECGSRRISKAITQLSLLQYAGGCLLAHTYDELNEKMQRAIQADNAANKL